jgi:hypothetical protein
MIQKNSVVRRIISSENVVSCSSVEAAGISGEYTISIFRVEVNNVTNFSSVM